ncbi:hypothetical protein FNH22_03850 [Fulvivirga sp. M361]|uniref:fibronectin type III domain-containing protein n=1 Tax=Fulvivirga sp. M361 TaxID=2594266 RepID=UPI00117B93C4|nr:hypothetical protein [Fulvivirga sp. M361]TRX61199.1 hypothetical protein FNH22_03850 [Fulvivirga sp. M361]
MESKIKKHYIEYVITTVLLLIYSMNVVYAQNETQPGVEVIGRAAKEFIRLRWAPNDPALWKRSNIYGYRLSRTTLVRDGNVLSNPEIIMLTDSALKPRPLAEWEPLVKTEPYAAVAAQALYGETFEVNGQQQGSGLQFINQAQELEQRFSYALFAADISVTVAVASGLKWEDRSVKPNEKYLYKVWSMVPSTEIVADTGYVYLGLEDYRPLPAVHDVRASFSDGQAQVSWDRSYYRDVYTGFHVDRSTDNGKSFQRATRLPIANIENKNAPDNRILVFLDSLDTNEQEYQYRVIGISPFGEAGPPSESVGGLGKKALSAQPVIKSANVYNQSSIQLTWEYPLPGEVSAFWVERANKADGIYERLHQNALTGSAVNFTDQKPIAVNYYRVIAENDDGSKAQSGAYLVQLEDTIPPSPPTGLKALIDSAGIVKLSWAENVEQDLFGYRVYRKNFRTDDFTQITQNTWRSNTFYDTININTLSKNVYYTVTAEDFHFNPSAYAPAVGLSRPDIVPPGAPVLKKAETTRAGVEISWKPSPSDDVAQYDIYRRNAGDNSWSFIASVSEATTSYTDGSIGSGAYAYEYTLVARDGGRLESRPSNPKQVTKRPSGETLVIDWLNGRANREKKEITLEWTTSATGVEKFQVYRSKDDGPFRYHASVKGGHQTFMDQHITKGNTYSYRVKAVFEKGYHSKFSEEIIIKY